jgi:hypothetical protein
VVRELGLDTKAVPLALSGGVLVASTGYRERFLNALRSMGLVAAPLTLVPEPARGAVRLALAALPRDEPAPGSARAGGQGSRQHG